MNKYNIGDKLYYRRGDDKIDSIIVLAIDKRGDEIHYAFRVSNAGDRSWLPEHRLHKSLNDLLASYRVEFAAILTKLKESAETWRKQEEQ